MAHPGINTSSLRVPSRGAGRAVGDDHFPAQDTKVEIPNTNAAFSNPADNAGMVSADALMML